MSASTIRIDVVSAEASIYSGTAAMVFATGELGELGIAPGHSPLITKLKPGQVRIQQTDGKEELIYVSGGLLEVQPYIVTVLADTAVRAPDLDEAAAIAAKERAEQLLQSKQSDFDYSLASAELAEAIAQLRTIQQLRKKLRM